MYLRKIDPVVKLRVWLLAASLLTPLCFAQSRSVQATIDASKTGAPISKNVYGQFLEHAGGLVNSAIWAEMLDDRKFYNVITSKPPAEPTGPAWMRRGARRWTPIGADDFVTMDEKKAYAGDHSPMIRLGNTARGIQQSGLAVRKGSVYTGRIVLAGAAGTVVNVNLVWGPGDADKQTVEVNVTGPEYKKYPLRFVAKADSDDARIEIVAKGSARDPHWSRIADAGRQRGGLPRGGRGRAQAVAFGVLSLSRRQFRLRPRVALRRRRHRQAAADLGSGLACRAAQRRRHGRVHDALPSARRRCLHHGQRRLRRRMVSAAQLVEYINGAATTPMGQMARRQRPSRSLTT